MDTDRNGSTCDSCICVHPCPSVVPFSFEIVLKAHGTAVGPPLPMTDTPANPHPPATARSSALARREVDPATAAEFAPITRGPVFAVLALGGLGVAAGFYMVWHKLAGRKIT